ncbi:MAG: phosphoadenylyl-sulfate reductase [Methylococcaceae bacterium]|nr:MAG: phosphoadenylyl-sulfate reductase [Methylococcaceae bacterium]
MNLLDINALQLELKDSKPRAILNKALSLVDSIAISFSGAEDVILIDLALTIKKDLAVFCLDTGRLHPETYRFIDNVAKHYGITIDILTPDRACLDPFVKAKGLFSFYQDGHHECCNLRKVEPLKNKLAQLDAWITGQRKDQSVDTRQHLPEVQWDTTFGSEARPLIKFNPLVNWNSAQVWDYIHAYQVPFNPLHQQGFVSIGCEPCTRAILPNEHERAGRWWWEAETKKECGLHAGNINPLPPSQA